MQKNGNPLYKQRSKAFRNACRIYINQKTQLLLLEKKYPFLKSEPATEDSALLHRGIFSDLNEAQRIVYTYRNVKDSTEYVESIFEEIESKCGFEAKSVLWKLLVNGDTQANVAKEYGVAKRTIQYWVKIWMDQEFTKP